ncbi:MAG: hypothetical protein LQ338_004589 [Usnochroma carphineum]|nr:MAG: hypothetical protein LQ338_004589 [Usnochroma carphineum]
MQEHIRRAHPEHYIPKLPATEESFQLMINSPPTERPQPPPNQSFGNTVYGHDRDVQVYDYASSPAAPRSFSESYPAAATAAVALAQLHNHGAGSEYGSEAVSKTLQTVLGYHREAMAANSSASRVTSRKLISNHIRNRHHSNYHPYRIKPTQNLYRHFSRLDRESYCRQLWLGLHLEDRPPRPRKSSISQNSRKAKHERNRSIDHARRLSIESRKALSAEPSGPAAVAQSRRWEDLLEAATSANEAESDRDLTPIPRSPSSVKRASLPPLAPAYHHLDSYKASPLQHALTPPPAADHRGIEPFPSIESSQSTSTSGHNFHIPSSGLSNSDAGTSPTFYPQAVQIYCANCRRVSVLKDSYACTECISGFCSDCVYVLSSEQHRGRPCPRCHVLGSRYKPFQLDFR